MKNWLDLSVLSIILVVFCRPIELSRPYSFSARLQNNIDNCPYESWDYIEDKFDCTNMSAMLGDYLKAKGYKVKYCIGLHVLPWKSHAWLRVMDTDTQKWYYVESTAKLISYKEIYNRYYLIICKSKYPVMLVDFLEWDYPNE